MSYWQMLLHDPLFLVLVLVGVGASAAYYLWRTR